MGQSVPEHNSPKNPREAKSKKIRHKTKVAREDLQRIEAMTDTATAPFIIRSGEVVRTSYGVGVVSRILDQNDRFEVRLWRVPGKSIASTSTANLHKSAILDRLPVAPGMVTTADSRRFQAKIMALCFYESRGTFLVAPIGKDETDIGAPSSWMELPPREIQTAQSAKFYPLLQELMFRGDQAASSTTSLLQSQAVSDAVQRTTELVHSHANKVIINDALKESNLQSIVPEEEETKDEVQRVVAMLKDEELTVLLENGRDRLRQLLEMDEISEGTRTALAKAGVRVADSSKTLLQTVHSSHQAALEAVNTLLGLETNFDSNDFQAVRDSLGESFRSMFDTLADAASSDRTLSSIFDTISGKTTDWQEATGRLLSTKSASLFMEGAGRLQARAVGLFSTDQLLWAGHIGSNLTKAFTEGDAAVARLKSIELGDAVRKRLFEAIEVRSESAGGLDGIIAGALSTLKHGEGESSNVGRLLESLQSSASSASSEAHETLISIVSQRSVYRDIALVRLEQVFCSLESEFAGEMSPDEIAAVARGEGGTANIFEPVARRAVSEIDRQLDVAEASVSDPTIVDVLKHVRRITRGELSVASMVDEVVNTLNDERIVGAGEKLIEHSENILDAIEGVSGNEVVNDAVQTLEKETDDLRFDLQQREEMMEDLEEQLWAL